MKKLVITADDYGMCESVNKAIDECLASGIVKSTNVMVNMDCAEAAKTLRARFPSVSVGLHYTLTAGKSVLPKQYVKTLVDDNGYFYRYPEFRSRMKRGLISKNEIVSELNAQYDKFKKLCGEPDYWNTHQNVHVAIGLFSLFCIVSRGRHIGRMRTHRRIYIPSPTPTKQSIVRKILAPFKTMLINKWSADEEKNGTKMPNGLLVFKNEDDKFNVAKWRRKIAWRNNKTAELCIHPAVSADCIYFGKITDKRIKEYEIFKDAETKRLITEAGIELCNMEL